MRAGALAVLLLAAASAGGQPSPVRGYAPNFGRNLSASLREARAWSPKACLVRFEYEDLKVPGYGDTYRYFFRSPEKGMAYMVAFETAGTRREETDSVLMPERCISSFPLELKDAAPFAFKAGLQRGPRRPFAARYYFAGGQGDMAGFLWFINDGDGSADKTAANKDGLVVAVDPVKKRVVKTQVVKYRGP